MKTDCFVKEMFKISLSGISLTVCIYVKFLIYLILICAYLATSLAPSVLCVFLTILTADSGSFK